MKREARLFSFLETVLREISRALQDLIFVTSQELHRRQLAVIN